jgi:hypothetical protein
VNRAAAADQFLQRGGCPRNHVGPVTRDLRLDLLDRAKPAVAPRHLGNPVSFAQDLDRRRSNRAGERCYRTGNANNGIQRGIQCRGAVEIVAFVENLDRHDLDPKHIVECRPICA